MLSIIIPTFDAGATLDHCLAALGPTAAAEEIVIVDGGSADDSRTIAQAAGARLILSARGRGVQLANGADAARGDWLLFLHADTILDPGWRAAVAAHVAARPESAACFRFRLDDDAWQARLIAAAVALRVRLFGLPYGDQGLLVPGALYRSTGGYRPLALMEDVDLVRRIGRRRLRMLDVDAVTSAVRWRSDGWFRRSGRNLACLALYSFGVAPERIARLYRA